MWMDNGRDYPKSTAIVSGFVLEYYRIGCKYTLLIVNVLCVARIGQWYGRFPVTKLFQECDQMTSLRMKQSGYQFNKQFLE